MYLILKYLLSFVNKLHSLLLKTLQLSTPSILNVNYLGVKFKVDGSYNDALIKQLSNPETNWEREELMAFLNLVHYSKSILDIGANQGIYSVMAGLVNPNTKIYAFEPYDSNSKKIKKNIFLNSIVNQVQINEIALGDMNGSVTLNVPIDPNITSSVTSINEGFTNEWHKEIRAIQVPLFRLDTWVDSNSISNIDLIKLDVEYFEIQVLKGAVETIRKFQPVILCEVLIYEILINEFPSMKGKLDPQHSYKIQSYFKELGYIFYTLCKDGIMKVETLHNHADSRNFLFSKYNTDNLFIAYSDKAEFRKLMLND